MTPTSSSEDAARMQPLNSIRPREPDDNRSSPAVQIASDLGAALEKATRVVLTVADHEKNGFVELAQWPAMPEQEARAFIQAQDDAVSDDSEPDIHTAPFTFILDLWADGDLIDNGKRLLPTQIAMALAPEQVREWLQERPDPDSVFYRPVPIIARAALGGKHG